MNEKTLAKIRRWYGAHAKSYRAPDGNLHAVLQLKFDHSARVAAEAAGIARELGWSTEMVRAARALGLLHDIGRFEQFTKFGTLFDPVSVDHGEQGYKVLKRSDTLSSCSAREKNAILNGVRYHNRRVIPPSVSADALPFVKLVRDADKIDIIYVLNEEIRRNRHMKHPEILLHIDLDGPPTLALVKQILDHRSGSYENVKTLADLNLMKIAWVYDINYLPSLRRILKRKLLDDLLGTMPSKPTAGARKIKDIATEYIKAMLTRGKPELSRE